MPRRIVAGARADVHVLHVLERHLQSVEAAVHFEVLRREGQQIVILRGRRQAREPGVEIVAVLEEGGAGAGRQFRHHVGLRAVAIALRLLQDPLGNIVGALARDVRIVGIKTARIQRVDQHAGANGAVHDVGLFHRVFGQSQEAAAQQIGGMYGNRHNHCQDGPIPPPGQEQIKGQHQEDCKGAGLEDLAKQALTGHPALHQKGANGSHRFGKQVA